MALTARELRLLIRTTTDATKLAEYQKQLDGMGVVASKPTGIVDPERTTARGRIISVKPLELGGVRVVLKRASGTLVYEYSAAQTPFVKEAADEAAEMEGGMLEITTEHHVAHVTSFRNDKTGKYELYGTNLEAGQKGNIHRLPRATSLKDIQFDLALAKAEAEMDALNG